MAEPHAMLIHVGYHKTGSTWMQRNLFSFDGIGFQMIGKGYEARQHLVLPNALDFEPTAAREALDDELAEAVDAGRVPVISDERLSGNPHSGGIDSKEIAERLRRTFPEARILFVIREQLDMLYSTYDQYVWEGGTNRVEDYLAPDSRHAVPMFDFAHFKYHRLIEHYQNLFGANRVLTLTFEDFQSRKKAFVDSIVEFADAEAATYPDLEARENPGRAALSLALLRRLNPFMVRDCVNANSSLAMPSLRWRGTRLVNRLSAALPASWHRGYQTRLHGRIAGLARDVYADSNRRTSELTGLDLAALSYTMPR